MQVVDGVQRLTTIYQFVRENKFPLVQLEYLKDEVEGRKFDYLADSVWAKRINNTQIVANVIDPQTPLRVKFDIFKRINTGGTPLNSQEIRHCMSGDKSRTLLRELTSTDEFNRATGETLRNHVRMADREMALRVVAFVLLGVQGFYESEGLDDFLNKATHAIDTLLPVAESRNLAAQFTHAMDVAYQIFGDHAFRKWTNYETKKSPINRAIFEALGTVLCKTSESDRRPPAEIARRFRELCGGDGDFLASVTQSTGSPFSVATRFAKLQKVVEK